jgi:hypothetical protein
MEAAVKRFFSSPQFAVAGASGDPSKFGYKSELTFSRIARCAATDRDINRVIRELTSLLGASFSMVPPALAACHAA